MTISGFIVLILVVTIGVLVFIELAGMPGRIAREREHPEAAAINILGWLGFPVGLVPWLIAMVWANMSLSPIAIVRTDTNIEEDDEPENT